MFAFSPILTLALKSVLKTRRPSALGIAGIGFGLTGALLIVLSKGQIDAPAQPVWIAIAFLIPLTLAIGNVYRTMDWPADTGALPLAAGTNPGAALFICVVSFVLTAICPLERRPPPPFWYWCN